MHAKDLSTFIYVLQRWIQMEATLKCFLGPNWNYTERRSIFVGYDYSRFDWQEEFRNLAFWCRTPEVHLSYRIISNVISWRVFVWRCEMGHTFTAMVDHILCKSYVNLSSCKTHQIFHCTRCTWGGSFIHWRPCGSRWEFEKRVLKKKPNISCS